MLTLLCSVDIATQAIQSNKGVVFKCTLPPLPFSHQSVSCITICMHMWGYMPPTKRNLHLQTNSICVSSMDKAVKKTAGSDERLPPKTDDEILLRIYFVRVFQGTELSCIQFPERFPLPTLPGPGSFGSGWLGFSFWVAVAIGFRCNWKLVFRSSVVENWEKVSVRSTSSLPCLPTLKVLPSHGLELKEGRQVFQVGPQILRGGRFQVQRYFEGSLRTKRRTRAEHRGERQCLVVSYGCPPP